MTIKKYWIAAITAGILTACAMAQTSASGSASGNASVTPGQAGASASTSQNAQTSGASANVDANASANTKASHEQENKNKDKGSSSGVSAAGNTAGAATAGAGDLSAALTSGTAMQAELNKTVDAKKAKAGDEVSARLTQDVKSNGHVVLHKGSKLVGHVTEAQARSKENAESKLGILFDKAVLKGGQEVSFNSVIQAVAPPVQATSSLAGDESSSLGGSMGGSSMGRSTPSGGAPLGGAVGGVTNTAGSAVGGVGSTAGNVAGSATGGVSSAANGTVGAAANGALGATSRGVIGMQGLALNTAAAGSAQGSVISSTTQNVKLDGGTRMVLQIAGSAAAK